MDFLIFRETVVKKRQRMEGWLKSPAGKTTVVILGLVFFASSFVSLVDPGRFAHVGYGGVFVFNLFGAGSLLSFTLAQQLNIFGLALASSLGLAINDSVAWLIGKNGDVLIKRPRRVKAIELTVKKWGPVALFFWSLIPFPYDLVGIVAGYLEIPFGRYFLATMLGKFIRSLLIGLGVIAAVRFF